MKRSTWLAALTFALISAALSIAMACSGAFTCTTGSPAATKVVTSTPRASGGHLGIPDFDPTQAAAVMDATFPVYWVGAQYKGLPLTNVSTQREPLLPGFPGPPTNAVQLSYGDCDASQGSCPIPLNIRTEAYCSRRPEFLAGPDGPPFLVRGARAQWVAGGGGPPTLLLYTGDVTITLIAIHETREFVLALANSIVPVDPQEVLATPTSHVLPTASAPSELGPVTAQC